MAILRYILVAATGFLLYAFVHELGIGWQRRSSRRRDLERALNGDPGRMNLSGPGRGRTERVEDGSGARSYRVVGRGVVHR